MHGEIANASELRTLAFLLLLQGSRRMPQKSPEAGKGCWQELPGSRESDFALGATLSDYVAVLEAAPRYGRFSANAYVKSVLGTGMSVLVLQVKASKVLVDLFGNTASGFMTNFFRYTMTSTQDHHPNWASGSVNERRASQRSPERSLQRLC